jgi:nickel-dependent lactate racemase
MNINQIIFSIDALILLGVSTIHFYWAFGGKWGANAVLPQINSEKRVFTPSPLMTLAVAVPFLIISRWLDAF